MARSSLLVREATPRDAEALIALWSATGPDGDEPTVRRDAPQALAQCAADPDQRVLVGEHEGAVVAAIHVRRAPISPLHLEQIVHTSRLVVDTDHRRHGYGRCLLEAAVAWAEEKDIAHVSATVAGGARDTNRFLARLGLGTFGSVRVAPTAVLRSRLSPARRGGARNIGQVLAERRSLRRRSELAPESPGEVGRTESVTVG